ncbi:MAG TPA: class I SAM-dependent methyltransferase [Ktedonobacteraceae bacterium]|jgi:ubiquinone/menaquinone biosynthesis C-methylase UbiE|nr:class I SAM-dependent methyltransferase [Ktedonobacteraceae bacterium]
MREPGKDGNTFINSNSGAEIARQMSQEPLLLQAMGGLFSEKADLSDVHYLLDVYCGPGGWALEMAFYHPNIEIIAIDTNRHNIEYAQAQAKVQGLSNVHFICVNPVWELDFPDDTFDIINARFISAFLQTQDWPGALQEFVRISKPNGIIRLIESDEPFTSSSAACERLKQLSAQALALHGQSFHPLRGAVNSRVAARLGKFLREAGCQRIQEKAYVINYASDALYNNLKYDSLKVLYKLAQPFLCAKGVAMQSELDQLYEQMLTDMLTNNFYALWYFLSCWGYVMKS